MNRDIRTRPVSRAPREPDKAARMPKELMRRGLSEAKEKLAEPEQKDAGAPENYATNKAQEGMEYTAQNTGGAVVDITGKAKDRLIKGIKERKDAVDTPGESHAGNGASGNGSHEQAVGGNTQVHKNPVNEQAKRQPAESDKRRVQQMTRERRGLRGADTVKPASDTAKSTTKMAAKGSVKTAQKSVKTTSKAVKATSRSVKTAQKTAKTAAKTAKQTIKASQQALRAAKVAAKAAARAAQSTAKVAATGIKMAAAAVKGLIMLIAAGGWIVLLFILFIACIVLIIGSAFGIFSGGGANGTPTIAEAMQTINTEYYEKIEQIKRDAGTIGSVSILVEDAIEGEMQTQNWPDVLGVFAVKTTMNEENGMDIVEMDDTRINKLRDIFWEMNTVSHTVTTYTEPENSPASSGAPRSPAPVTSARTSPAISASPSATASPEPVTMRLLTITVASKSYEDMLGTLDTEQAEMLKELMSVENASMWMELASPVTGEAGTDWRGVIAVPDGGMDIPLYIQGDYKTTVCYLGGEAKSAASSGCGAACSSMVISYLTGNTSQNPHTLFKWAYDNGYYHGSGLSHSAVSAMLNLYGVSGEWIGKDEAAIVAALTEGKPIIAHMGPGVFTKGGHYILLRGITEDGHVLINDPGSKKRNGYAYPLSLILAQSKSATPFMVCGK